MNGISVLMGFIDDPYLAIFVKKIYERHWKEDIKELLITVNGPNKDVCDFITNYWKTDDKVTHIKTHYEKVPAGKGYNALYQHTTGDVIMIMDMDNFILRKNVLYEFEGQLTSGEYDAIGSHSHAATRRIYERATARFGHCRLNMSMLILKKEMLDHLEDVDFSRKFWYPGDYIKPLDWTVPNDFPRDYRHKYEHGDVTTYLSLQIFAYTKKVRIIPINCPDYTHAGALSSILKSIPQTQPTTLTPVPLQRIAWWYYIYQATHHECTLTDFNQRYKDTILQYAKHYNLPEENLRIFANNMLSKYPTLK